MEVTEVQVIIAWQAIRDIFILEVGVPKVTVIQILVIAVCLHFICSSVCLHFVSAFVYIFAFFTRYENGYWFSHDVLSC